MRYRDMARVDLNAAGTNACRQAAFGQMAEELKGEYEEHAEAMAIVLRGIMARYTNNPEELADLQVHTQLDRPGHLPR